MSLVAYYQATYENDKTYIVVFNSKSWKGWTNWKKVYVALPHEFHKEVETLFYAALPLDVAKQKINAAGFEEDLKIMKKLKMDGQIGLRLNLRNLPFPKGPEF